MSAPAILGRAELREIVSVLATNPQPWSHLVRHDPAQRVFECLRLDDHVEIWLICWMPGHDTGFHDHDDSAAAITVLDGAITEERLAITGAVTRSLTRGDTVTIAREAIHRVIHAGTTPATTLHAYSPPLRRMGAYLVQPGGTLERHPLAKDQELRPLTSAA